MCSINAVGTCGGFISLRGLSLDEGLMHAWTVGPNEAAKLEPGPASRLIENVGCDFLNSGGMQTEIRNHGGSDEHDREDGL